jgi:hypothetical protein
MELLENETIILRANLVKQNWMCFRCCTCSWSVAHISFIWGPIYGLFGGMCRREEADSFELILTDQNIHWKQKLYICGLCCQSTTTKVIPLDKIQDIELVSDCCGDTCGYVNKAGDIYQVHFQTAGQGTEKAELSVFCIENPREFKKSVLDAKARVRTDTTIAGQSKTIQVSQQVSDLQSYQNQERLTRVLELLERQLSQKVPV